MERFVKDLYVEHIKINEQIIEMKEMLEVLVLKKDKSKVSMIDENKPREDLINRSAYKRKSTLPLENPKVNYSFIP